MLEFVRNHAVRLYAVFAAAVAVASQYVELPVEALLAGAAAVLGLGEAAQRTEDRKTVDAYLTDVR